MSDAAMMSSTSIIASTRTPRPGSPRRTAPSSLTITAPTSARPPTVTTRLKATTAADAPAHSVGNA